MPPPSENINLFMLYAEEDLALKKDLEAHLSLLSQKGYIDIWHEGKIVYHQNADVAIQAHLEKADLILLLISSNFLLPEVYGKYEQALRAAYARQQRGATQIIPVILRPCVWQLDFLSNLEPLPKGGYPVRSRHWDNHDLAFQNITMGILNKVDQLRNGPPPAKPPPLPFQRKSTDTTDASHQDTVALVLINELFKVLSGNNPRAGAQMVLPLIHKSLIQKGQLELNFKQFKFWKAYEKMHLYKFPLEVKSKKASGRNVIGILLDQEKGEEWIYTLKKIEDLGGISGQVRIFFPEARGAAKISSISL